MKRIIIIVLSLFIMPILVNAETFTYNVCDTCEYADYESLSNYINSISNLSDKDIIINVNSDISSRLSIGSLSNMPNSVTINGNNHFYNTDHIIISSKKVVINDIIDPFFFKNDDSGDIETFINKINEVSSIIFLSAESTELNNSYVTMLYNYYDLFYQDYGKSILVFNNSHVNYVSSANLNADDSDLGYITDMFSKGTRKYNFKNTKINGFVLENINEKMNYFILTDTELNADNTLFRMPMFMMNSNANFNNCVLSQLLSYSESPNTNLINIYNSKIRDVSYINIDSEENNDAIINSNFDLYNPSTWPFNIIDFFSSVHIYYDDTIILNPNDIIDLKEKFGFENEGLWSLEENIAEINGNKLQAIKPGETKLLLNADKEHFSYNIKLIVNKETLPEKISNTIENKIIKVPITGKSIKLWIVIVTALLLSVIGVCSYILIRKRK